MLIPLTNTPDAPRANALKTSVPRRTPPSRKTGTRPCAALTTCKLTPATTMYQYDKHGVDKLNTNYSFFKEERSMRFGNHSQKKTEVMLLERSIGKWLQHWWEIKIGTEIGWRVKEWIILQRKSQERERGLFFLTELNYLVTHAY